MVIEAIVVLGDPGRHKTGPYRNVWILRGIRTLSQHWERVALERRVRVLRRHDGVFNRGELLVEEFGVETALRQQLRVRAPLNDFPALHDQDLIC